MTRTATVDDGTCEVTAENNCPTDLNGDGTTTVSDLLILLGAFATDCEEQSGLTEFKWKGDRRWPSFVCGRPEIRELRTFVHAMNS